MRRSALISLALGALVVPGEIAVPRASGSLASPRAPGTIVTSGAPRPGPRVGPVVLPRDHGAHPAFGVEWWYTAGTLRGAHGHKLFWFATLWHGFGASLARVNVVDLHADRIVLAHEYLGLAPVSGGQTRLTAGGFRLAHTAGGRWGAWIVRAALPGGSFLSLRLRPRQPYLLHGHAGVIRQGPHARSDYYSSPRLAASGTLESGGRRQAVRGLGWLDHQWGNFASDPLALRWNWFACQFDDGSDLMLYQFLGSRLQPSGQRSATLRDAAGRVTHPRAFTITPLAPSIHPAGSAVAFPLRWRLTLPGAGIDITLKASARAQFIRNHFVPSFWEGAAAITHGRAGQCIVESSRAAGGPPAAAS